MKDFGAWSAGLPMPLSAILALVILTSAANAIIDLRVSPDGHRFERKSDGTPFLWMAMTHYTFPQDATREQVDWALDKRKSQGFTVIKFELWDGEHPEFQTNAYGDKLRLNNGDPNPKYFEHIDYIIDHARQRDMYILFVFNKNANPGDQSFYQWIGLRYKDRTNIFWCTWSVDDDIRDQAEGIAKGTTGVDNLSWRTANQAWDQLFISNYFPSPESYWQDAWCTLRGSNKPYMDNISSGYAQTPARPVVVTDGAYSPGETGDAAVRHDMCNRLYQVFLSGGYFTYGWYADWDGLPPPSTYEAGFDSPGSAVITKFMLYWTAREWSRLRPSNGILTSKPDGCLAMKSEDNDAAYVYFSNMGSATVNLSAIATGAGFKAMWFNPSTGTTLDLGVITKTSSIFTTPSGWEDALLELVKQGSTGVLPVGRSPKSSCFSVFCPQSAFITPVLVNGRVVRLGPDMRLPTGARVPADPPGARGDYLVNDR